MTVATVRPHPASLVAAPAGRTPRRPATTPEGRRVRRGLTLLQLATTILSWLAVNRGDLTVFVHPNTGRQLVDHRDRAIWLGRQETLDLSVLPD